MQIRLPLPSLLAVVGVLVPLGAAILPPLVYDDQKFARENLGFALPFLVMVPVAVAVARLLARLPWRLLGVVAGAVATVWATYSGAVLLVGKNAVIMWDGYNTGGMAVPVLWWGSLFPAAGVVMLVGAAVVAAVRRAPLGGPAPIRTPLWTSVLVCVAVACAVAATVLPLRADRGGWRDDTTLTGEWSVGAAALLVVTVVALVVAWIPAATSGLRILAGLAAGFWLLAAWTGLEHGFSPRAVASWGEPTWGAYAALAAGLLLLGVMLLPARRA